MHHSLVYKIRRYSGSCFRVFKEKICCRYSLEGNDTSNVYPQKIFSGRHKRNNLRATCLKGLF